MKILVTGAKGQLGTDVINELGYRLTRNSEPGPSYEYFGVDVQDFDITDADAVAACFRAYKPDIVIHCAAYTAVDKAEDEAELCMKINAEGTENIAIACKKIGAEMIYISTDYVFGGTGDAPYETDAPKNPLQIYGKSKLAGEEAVIRHTKKYFIVRISWVFGKNGHNFVKAIRQLAKDRREINVVNDQVGSPTYTPDLAKFLCDILQSKKYGIYHATNEGYCSWADFAKEIMRLTGSKCRVNSIMTKQYPTKATRPKNSRMSKTSLDKAGFKRLPTWQNALERYLRS